MGKVEGEQANVKPETTPAGKKKRSDSPKPSPRSSKKKPSTSSRPSSEDLKNLDDKWADRFARLEAMLLSKSFAVPVESVVKPAEVITSQKPFFDPGASTSKLAESAEIAGPSLVKATGDAVPPRGDEIQLCHRFQTSRLGQWMHSACLGKIWTHMPSHHQPSWAKW